MSKFYTFSPVNFVKCKDYGDDLVKLGRLVRFLIGVKVSMQINGGGWLVT